MPSSISNKGLSEVTGAVLIMAIIALVTGLIYLKFQPIFYDSVENLKMESVRKEMVELRELMGRVVSGVEPVTEKLLSLYGGRTYIDHEFIAADGKLMKIGVLTIKVGARRIVAGSGVFEVNEVSATRILKLPEVRKSRDRIYISLIDVQGNVSSGGDKVNLRLSEKNSSLLEDVSNFRIVSEFCSEWSRVFTLNDIPSVDRCPDYVEIISDHNISIRVYRVEIS